MYNSYKLIQKVHNKTGVSLATLAWVAWQDSTQPWFSTCNMMQSTCPHAIPTDAG